MTIQWMSKDQLRVPGFYWLKDSKIRGKAGTPLIVFVCQAGTEAPWKAEYLDGSYYDIEDDERLWGPLEAPEWPIPPLEATQA